MSEQLNVGDIISVDYMRHSTRRNALKREFNMFWANQMDEAMGDWVVLEVEEENADLGNNRFSSRATRMNAYTYCNDYEFKSMRRNPRAYFIGRKKTDEQ